MRVEEMQSYVNRVKSNMTNATENEKCLAVYMSYGLDYGWDAPTVIGMCGFNERSLISLVSEMEKQAITKLYYASEASNYFSAFEYLYAHGYKLTEIVSKMTTVFPKPCKALIFEKGRGKV